MRKYAILILVLASTSSAALATYDEMGDIVTDRPDFTESAVVIPTGHIQFESGLTWIDDGDDAFTSDESDPGVILTAGRDLGDSWSIGSQLSADWVSGADERSLFWAGALGGPWGSFAEVAFTIPEEGDTATLIHGSATYLVTPNVQIDLHGGVGAMDTAPDFFVGAGVSVRR